MRSIPRLQGQVLREAIVATYLNERSVRRTASKLGIRTDRVTSVMREEGYDLMAMMGERVRELKLGKRMKNTISRVGLGRSPSATEWAYIAGLFDGEGSLTWQRVYTSTRSVRIDISQKRVSGLLEWLRETLGCGSVQGNGGTYKDVGAFRIAAARCCYEFCKGVLPYLIVKRDSVITALSFFAQEYGWE